MEESKDDLELHQEFKEELERILGTEEEYGLVEEIQEEIVTAILPETESDKQPACTLEIM